LLFLIASSPIGARLAWRAYGHRETVRSGKIAPVERHQEVRLSVNRGLQHQIIVRIAQARPPQEGKANRLRDNNQRVEQCLHIRNGQARLRQMLSSRQNCLVFDQ
jgi:hypothetical protein